jgi:hypothetical protein
LFFASKTTNQRRAKTIRGDIKSAWRLLEATGVNDRPNPGTTDADLLAIELEMEHQPDLIRLRRLKAKVELEDISTDIPE